MNVTQTRVIFTANLAILVRYMNALPDTFVIIDEVKRTPSQQALYYTSYIVDIVNRSGLNFPYLIPLGNAPASQTLKSSHLDGLAADVLLFTKGVFQVKTENYKEMAEYWKSLHPQNYAGYDNGNDGVHLGMHYLPELKT